MRLRTTPVVLAMPKAMATELGLAGARWMPGVVQDLMTDKREIHGAP